MSKIIDFSSVYEEPSVATRIDTIKSQLKKGRISKRRLHHLQDELLHLSSSLTDQLKHVSMQTHIAMHEFLRAQTELGALLFDCKNIFIDRQVDSLTSHAQKIARASVDPCMNVSRKITRLHKSIASLMDKEALSLENRQMINVAKKYLQDAQQRCYLETSSKNTKTIRLDFQKANQARDWVDPYDMSLALYETAGLLYQGKGVEGEKEFRSLAPSLQQEIGKLLEEKHLSFQALALQENLVDREHHLYGIIQVLLGYSNKLLYESLTVPSVQEIDELFQDLEAHLKEEISMNF